MVADGQNGCLVEAEDVKGLAAACNQLLGDAEKRIKMGTGGWNIVNQKFNIERQVDKLEGLYIEQLNAYGKS
jgi:glycosyltransferase involved in cell wall biosynthesis